MSIKTRLTRIAVAATLCGSMICPANGLWASDAPGLKYVKVTFKLKQGKCHHDVDGIDDDLVPIHKTVSQQGHDVLIWRIFNQCKQDQAVCIEAPNSPFVNCAGEPATVTVGTLFKVDAATDAVNKVKAFGICTIDWTLVNQKRTVHFKTRPWANGVTCSSIGILNHQISVDVVP